MAFLNDGFSTTIQFNVLALVPVIFKIKEKTVTPPGFSGGGPIDITTMRNLTLRTKAPKHLKQMDEVSLTVSYDPVALIFAYTNLINVNTTIAVNFPDGSQISFWGFLNDIKPQENREGEQPLASLTLVCTNYDLVSQTEQLPVYTAAA